jgi:hypothetical protein
VPSKRILRFTLAILTGLALGLVYGWILRPAVAQRADPRDLRQDYQMDYVLMVAEVYDREGNVAQATERLHYLGNEPVRRYVQRAILAGGQAGLDPHDMDVLNRLDQALGSWIPQPEEAAP